MLQATFALVACLFLDTEAAPFVEQQKLLIPNSGRELTGKFLQITGEFDQNIMIQKLVL